MFMASLEVTRNSVSLKTLQCMQEKERALESVCWEMEQKKAHYERRIGDLSGCRNDANNRTELLEVSHRRLAHESSVHVEKITIRYCCGL